MRAKNTIVAFALFALAGANVSAQEPTPEALEALDGATRAAVDKAARSVVLLHVKRSATNTPLSMMERMRLGVRRSWYPPGFFARPDGPVSGVAIGPELVITSLWNVEGTGAIEVETPSGERLTGERVGRDENLRVALIKVPGASLTPIERATSTIRPGRILFLIGRRAENRPLVTHGIVAGLNRERGDAFTHSARTSFANCGGALVDLEGKLLGIGVRHTNRARQGQSSGVGFGADYTKVEPNLQALAGGKVIKLRPTAFLGISMDPNFTGGGVKILKVLDDTGAKTAGIADGDVVLIFNNVRVKHFAQLREEILKLQVGRTIIVSVKRGEKTIDYKVTLGARPEDRRRR